jgi:uncharacterized protein YecE (DUF72 family)
VIYVGTCGYAYKDWIGPFYAPKTKPAEMLPAYARRFRAVEVDSSYYGVPKPQTVASMAARTPRDFRFSFKLPQTVTHPADPSSLRVHDDALQLLESLEPAREAHKLACVLAQFPNGFKPEGNREEYLRAVVDAFAGVPVIVEFRNAKWQRPETFAMLREIGAGYCNVDMPRLDGLLAPSRTRSVQSATYVFTGATPSSGGPAATLRATTTSTPRKNWFHGRIVSSKSKSKSPTPTSFSTTTPAAAPRRTPKCSKRCLTIATVRRPKKR